MPDREQSTSVTPKILDTEFFETGFGESPKIRDL